MVRRRQEHEAQQAQPRPEGGQSGGALRRQHAVDQEDRHRQREVRQRRRAGHAQQVPQQGGVETPGAALQSDPPVLRLDQLAQHQQRGEAEADHRGQRCAGHPQPGKRSGPEDEQRVQHHVQHESQGHDLEGEDRVALAAEQGVDAHREEAEESAQEVDRAVLPRQVAHLRVGARRAQGRFQQQQPAGDQQHRQDGRHQDHVQQQVGDLDAALAADHAAAEAGAAGAQRAAEGVQQVGDREGEADRRHGLLAEASQVDHVRQTVAGHQEHRHDHGHAQAQQRRRDRSGQDGVGAAFAGTAAHAADTVEPAGHGVSRPSRGAAQRGSRGCRDARRHRR